MTIWLYKVDGIFASVLCLQDVNRFECVKPGEGDGNQQRTTTCFKLLISHYYYKCDENHILTKKYRAVLRIVAISSLNTCCLRVTSQLRKYFRVSSRRVEALNISGQVIKGIWGMPWH